jgi:5'-phosphate synthase pdxT subunit
MVGLLALQGDFPTHREALLRHGCPAREVRTAADLVGLTRLVLPGGESTTMLHLLREGALMAPLRDAIRAGLPTLATCAGTILLAHEVHNPVQESLALLDVRVERNGYGRQLSSGIHPVEGRNGFPDGTGCFIRAPRITRVGPRVRVLAVRGPDPVLVEQDHILAATFHPEMDDHHPAYDRFLSLR